jgi:hypothetical protein
MEEISHGQFDLTASVLPFSAMLSQSESKMQCFQGDVVCHHKARWALRPAEANPNRGLR